MAAYKYILCRAVIVDEYYEVEADDDEQALEMAYNGDVGDPFKTEFVDWRDDEFTITDRESLCPLVKMIKEYE